LSDYDIPKNLRYTTDDEWLREEDGQLVIGVTDFAQDQLGDIVYVELPEVGAELTAKEPFGVIESVKAVSDLVAPVSGAVMQVNPLLADQPEKVNEDCYGEGWMIAIAPSNPSELEALLEADGYRASVTERSD